MTKIAIRVVLLSMPLIVLLIALPFQPSISVYSGDTDFDAVRAMKLLEEITSKYKYRVVGSESSKRIVRWIADYFRGLGHETYIQSFYAPGFGRKRVLAHNVYAIKRGYESRYIILIAHHDIVPYTIEGANDNGAGLAILLELARVFANRSTRLSIIFLASDAEETGLHGAKYFADNFPQISRVVAAISIDMCAWKGSEEVSLMAFMGCRNPFVVCDGGVLYVIKSLERLGYRVRVARANIVSRVGLVMGGTDSMPFVDYGISSVGIVDYDYPYWHKLEDTIDKISVEKLEIVGTLVERTVLTIDSMGDIPRIGAHFIFLDGYVVTTVFTYLMYISTYSPMILFLYEARDILFQRRRLRSSLSSFLVLLLIMAVILLLSISLMISFGKAFEILVAAVGTAIVLNIVYGRSFRIEDWQSFKLVAATFMALAYSVGFVNPIVALIVLTPSFYLVCLAKPIDRRLTRFLLSIAYPCIAFVTELLFIAVGISIWGPKILSYNIAWALRMLMAYLPNILALVVFYSLTLAAVVSASVHVLRYRTRGDHH
ncbi:MAG: hypothetical protein DRJ36_00750 [Thermoprotei archaeon]|nr:MAG: hypothetical protein DRJ36_00750 [Thermoprotei archaeon]